MDQSVEGGSLPTLTTTYRIATFTDPWSVRLSCDHERWQLDVPVADARTGPTPRESLRGRWTDGSRTHIVERPARRAGRYRITVVDERDGRLVLVAQSQIRGAGWHRFDLEDGAGVPLVQVRPDGGNRFVARTPEGTEVGRVGHRWPPLRDDLGPVRRWVDRLRQGPLFELHVDAPAGPLRDAVVLGLLLPDLCRDRRDHGDGEDPVSVVLDD